MMAVYRHRHFLIPLIVFFLTVVRSEPLVEKTIGVYKCQESTDPVVEKMITVPSYRFQTQMILRILEEPFQGCGSSAELDSVMNETELVYLQYSGPPMKQFENIIRKNIIDIEYNHTSISPQGVLNVKNHFYNKDEFCIVSYTAQIPGKAVPVLKFKYCPANCSSPEELCIRKCCPVGKVHDLEAGSCKPSGNLIWTPFLYDELSPRNLITKGSAINKRRKIHYFKEKFCTASDAELETWLNRKTETRALKTKLLSNGQLMYLRPERRWDHFDTSRPFCIDGIQNVFGSNGPFYSGEEDDQMNTDTTVSTLYMYCLYGAASFYLATTIIYTFLWDKHNTRGWTIFSLVVARFFMCLFVGNAHLFGIYQIANNGFSKLCVSNAVLGHFFTLAAFAWLTVINFDLWSTFRAFKVRSNKTKDFKKLFLYCTYGWGVPLIVVTVGVILDQMFQERESLVIVPEYGVTMCYVAVWAQGPYIYYINAVQLSITVILSIVSSVKIYKFHKEGSDARCSSSAGDRKMFWLYGKLSVLLGTSWIFEFISWVASSQNGESQHWIWIAFDMYNMLTAVFIFLIFGCKRSNFTKLIDKYPRLKPVSDIFAKWRRKSDSSAATGTTGRSTLSSRDTNPLRQVADQRV